MKYLSVLILWLLTAVGGLYAGEPVYPLIEVEDGDTLLMEIDGAPVRIQLAAIDAPEAVPNPKLQRDLQRTRLPQGKLVALGRAATAHLGSMVKQGDRLVLRGDLRRRDKYGRVAVEVFDAAGRSLNEAMVADGFARLLARAPAETPLRSRLKAAQQRAMAAGRGLWGESGDEMRAWAGISP